MVKAGKIIALVAGLLTILGTFFFSLFSVPLNQYVYGAGGMFNIDDLFIYGVSGQPDAWISWIVGPILILYLISGFIMLLGMKSKIAAILGSILPLFVSFSLFFAWIDLAPPYIAYFATLSAEPIIQDFIPFTFEYGFMIIGLGSFIIAVGGILSLVSGFFTRDS